MIDMMCSVSVGCLSQLNKQHTCDLRSENWSSNLHTFNYSSCISAMRFRSALILGDDMHGHAQPYSAASLRWPVIICNPVIRYRPVVSILTFIWFTWFLQLSTAYGPLRLFTSGVSFHPEMVRLLILIAADCSRRLLALAFLSSMVNISAVYDKSMFSFQRNPSFFICIFHISKTIFVAKLTTGAFTIHLGQNGMSLHDLNQIIVMHSFREGNVILSAKIVWRYTGLMTLFDTEKYQEAV